MLLQVVQATQLWKVRRTGSAEVSWNWLQLMCCLPSIASRVFQTEVMNWVSRRFWNGGSVLVLCAMPELPRPGVQVRSGSGFRQWSGTPGIRNGICRLSSNVVIVAVAIR